MNADAFAVKVLGMQPFDYQMKILADDSKRAVLCMGRGSGKTIMTAVKALWFVVSHPEKRVIIVSPSLRQSMEMFDIILSYVHNTALLTLVRDETRTHITFINGSRIDALPSGPTGKTIRGKHVDGVIVDEAIFMKDDIIGGVIMPMVAVKDGFVWLLSTAWDKNHIFWRAFADETGTWSRYHLPSSVNPMIKPSFLTEQRNLIGEARYRREYLCEFDDEYNTYFPMDLLRECFADYLPEPSLGGFGGFDPGGKDSLAAFMTVKRLGNEIRVTSHFAKHSESYTQINLEIRDFNSSFPMDALLVDKTGLGEPIVEALKDLNLPVDGLTLSERTKEEVFSNLRLLFEQRELKIPITDLTLINALNSIQYERTRTGALKFSHGAGTYVDSAYALGLACRSLKEHYAPIFIKRLT